MALGTPEEKRFPTLPLHLHTCRPTSYMSMQPENFDLKTDDRLGADRKCEIV